MQVIPVIDIKDGLAVHARQGRRDSYRPLQTRFASTADPLAVAQGLVAALPVTTLYVADLDAIMYARPNLALVERMARTLPGVRLLVDAGFGPTRPCAPWLAAADIDIVVASEALATLDEYAALTRDVPAARLALSLDRNADGLLGCPALFEQAERWPGRVIHMNLARVGAERGPDLAGLETLRERAGDRAVLAAGGVRDRNDLAALAALGVAAVLVGTALHDGRLDADDLAAAVRSSNAGANVTPAAQR